MSTGPMSSIEAVSVTGEEELAAKVKTTQEKMESVEADIAEAETTKVAAEDISDKIDSLDMNTLTMLTSLDASTLSPGCSWTEFEDLISFWSAAKENANALVTRLTSLISGLNDELNALKNELNALMAHDMGEMTGHCQGTSSNEQCNGKPNGTPCTKNCTASDCRLSVCCHGCCMRGNELAARQNRRT